MRNVHGPERKRLPGWGVGKKFGRDFPQGVCALLTDQLVFVKEHGLEGWSCGGGVCSERSQGVRCGCSYDRFFGSQGCNEDLDARGWRKPYVAKNGAEVRRVTARVSHAFKYRWDYRKHVGAKIPQLKQRQKALGCVSVGDDLHKLRDGFGSNAAEGPDRPDVSLFLGLVSREAKELRYRRGCIRPEGLEADHRLRAELGPFDVQYPDAQWNEDSVRTHPEEVPANEVSDFGERGLVLKASQKVGDGFWTDVADRFRRLNKLRGGAIFVRGICKGGKPLGQRAALVARLALSDDRDRNHDRKTRCKTAGYYQPLTEVPHCRRVADRHARSL